VNVDTQGTVLIQRTFAMSLLPRLRKGDFLIGAEITCWAIRESVTPIEIPIVYSASGRSTVSPAARFNEDGDWPVRPSPADGGRSASSARHPRGGRALSVTQAPQKEHIRIA
jgi:hypothetical protein